MTFDMLDAVARRPEGWVKSSLSGGTSCCLEVKYHGSQVLIRDSKFRRSEACDLDLEPVIALTLPQWAAFMADASGKADSETLGYAITPNRDGSVTVASTEEQTALDFTADEWLAFTQGIKKGEFDTPVSVTASL